MRWFSSKSIRGGGGGANVHSQTYIIPNPQLKGALNVPADLEPAKKWTGALRERLDILPDIHSGTYYTGVYASHRDKPLLEANSEAQKEATVERCQAVKLTHIAARLRRGVGSWEEGSPNGSARWRAPLALRWIKMHRVRNDPIAFRRHEKAVSGTTART
jgi:hypothetical protein